MATPRKRRTKTVADESYSKLDQYCIWLYEFHASLIRAGFDEVVARAIACDKDSYPDWVEWRLPSTEDIRKYLEEEED